MWQLDPPAFDTGCADAAIDFRIFFPEHKKQGL
jgi:hypothetical protein